MSDQELSWGQRLKQQLFERLAVKAKKSDSPNFETPVPNRRELRRKGLNRSQKVGNGFARPTRYKLTPAELHTHVSIPIRNSDGEITRRIIVPRAMLENKDV